METTCGRRKRKTKKRFPNKIKDEPPLMIGEV